MSGDRSNELYVAALQAEMRRTAERYRLTAAVPRKERRRLSIRIHRPALAWFGRILVEAGHRLQQQAQADSVATS